LIRQPAAGEGNSLPDVGVDSRENSEIACFFDSWLMLAVARATELERVDIKAKEPGIGLALLAAVYGLALLAGFL
jgi:hypothetical protein